MVFEAIFHRTYSEYCFALTPNRLCIRLRAKKNDLSACTLFFGDRMDSNTPIHTTQVPMRKKFTDSLFDYYEAEFPVGITRVCYYFQLFDESGSVYYYNDGFFDVPDENRQLYFTFHYIRSEDIAHVPAWAEKAIVYQIYPDSFASGVATVSGQPSQVQQPDGSISRSKFGGTLKGIAENIDYLVKLGVNCIYLTPIFRSNSWHKYDTTDYYEIDPCLGTKDDFKELIAVCHRNSIRIMLDAVFNHCGPDFFAFRDVLEKGESSAYKDWFYIKDFPVRKEQNPNYECFAYVETMPKLNTGNPEVARYLLDVALYWTREFGIDSWRLDVANEVNFDFWRDFRREMKSCNSDIWIVGEIWDDARAFLQGEQMDSLMNYNLYFACVDFFAKGTLTAAEFDGRVNYLLTRYKKSIQYAQMNLIDSHDVPRFLSYAGGDIRKLKLAALFLLTHVGAPSIYYGDERGMSGWHDVEYRAPMPWEQAEDDTFAYYQRLIRLRRDCMDVMLGEYRTILADEKLYIYARQSDHQKITIALNNSDSTVTVRLAVENNAATLYEYLSGNEYGVTDGKAVIGLEPYCAAVFLTDFPSGLLTG